MALSQASGRPRTSFLLPSRAGLAASRPLGEAGSGVDGHGSESTGDVVSLEGQHAGVAEKCDGVDLDFDFRCYFLSAPRADLYHRIDRRCEEMVEGNPQWNGKRRKLRRARRCMLKSLSQLLTGGMLQEADWMLREGIEPGSNPASRAIGYRQVRCSDRGVGDRLWTLIAVETKRLVLPSHLSSLMHT